MFHAANFISQALGGVLAGPSRSATMMPDEKYPALYDTRRLGEGGGLDIDTSTMRAERFELPTF